MELQVPHHGQDVAPQTAEALSQQEEAVGHAGQLQVLLGVGAADAAVEEGQLDRGVHRHGEAWGSQAGPGLRVLQMELVGVNQRD